MGAPPVKLHIVVPGSQRLSILDTGSLCIFQARLLSKCRIAHLLLRMPEIIATPCSVKAMVMYLVPSLFDIPNWDVKLISY